MPGDTPKTPEKKVPRTPQPPMNGKPPKKPWEMFGFEVNINLNRFFNRGLIFLVIFLLFLPYLRSLLGIGGTEYVSLSQLVRDVREEKVETLQVTGTELRAVYKDGARK